MIASPPTSLEGDAAPSKPDENKCWDPGGIPNAHISQIICSAMVAAASDEGNDTQMEDEGSRTELGSHANMVVVGNNCLVIEFSG
jgi:hypothetical protein